MRILMLKDNHLLALAYLRLPQVLALYPVSKSQWYQGIKDGVHPKPVRLSARISAWKACDIIALLENADQGGIDNA
jgi:predicted DNA-binding transcriptional regulator AlpA